MIKLRDYQEDSINAIWDYFAQGGKGNPIAALPTGTGKSICIAEFIRRACVQYPNTRVLMLTHVKELIEQNYDKLLSIWPQAPAGIFSAGVGKKESHCPITYAGIQSVNKKSALFGHIDLILIDECHLVSPSASTMYNSFINSLKSVNPHIKVIGFSATPYRMKSGSLTEGGLFTDVCYDITQMDDFNRLILKGYLAPLIPKRTKEQLDTSEVGMRGGEFINKELQEAVNKQDVTTRALSELVELGDDRNHWMIFGAGIDHCISIADTLYREFGIEALAVHSRMKRDEREEAIKQFKDGSIRALVNTDILTTGFDFPALDLIGVMRPTQSPGLWVQMLGRGTRPFEGKDNCLVLDFAANTERLGPINDPVIPKRRGSSNGAGGGGAPIKLCPECFSYEHISVRECSDCGYKFDIQAPTVDLHAASSKELIAQRDVPEVHDFQVTTVNYSKHISSNPKKKIPTLKVTYSCGLRMFSEYVCLEHHGARIIHKAQSWWAIRSPQMEDGDQPQSIDEALERLDELIEPSFVKVWVNKKYPEIINFDWEEVDEGFEDNIPF